MQVQQGFNVCTVCNLQFQSVSALRNHLINSSVHFYCKSCNRDFVSKTALNSHLTHSSLHRSDANQQHGDDVADRLRGRSSDKSSVQFSAGPILHCYLCGKSGHIARLCPNKNTVATPQSRLSGREETVSSNCTTCNMQFRDRESLIRHLETNPSHRELYDPFCDIFFETVIQKTLHTRATPQKHHLCYRCDHDYSTAERLHDHYAMSEKHVHTYCDICKQDFGSAEELKQVRDLSRITCKY